MYRDKFRQNHSYDEPFALFPPQSINSSREAVAPYPIEDTNEVINPIPVFTTSNSHSATPNKKNPDRYEMPFQYAEPALDPLVTSSPFRVPPSISTPTNSSFPREVRVGTPLNEAMVPPPPYEESEARVLQEKAYRVESPPEEMQEASQPTAIPQPEPQPQVQPQAQPQPQPKRRERQRGAERERDLSGYSPKAVEFYKVYKATVDDSTNFTPGVQMKWCETLLEYAFDDEFLSQYNINAEKLKRTLRPDECLKNQKVLLGHSFRVLTKLVSRKCGPAMYLMGTLYSHQPYLKIKNKNIVDRNDKKALEYYCRAAKTNHADACYRAGVCFEYQRGTPTQDFSKERALQKAFQYYERGATHCDNDSCMYKLGMFYLYGSSGLQDPLEALQWLTRASEDGKSMQALYELGKVYEFTSLSPQLQSVLTRYNINRDPATALKYFHKSAMDYDYPLAQWKLGYAYEFGELQLPVIAKKSIAWYAKAALAQPKGNPMAMLALSGWYLTGAPNVLKPNDKEAFKWASRACEASDGKLSRAEYALACYHENGIGCERDLTQARIHFETAMRLGHIKARERLERGF